jgi:acyl carrier protein
MVNANEEKVLEIIRKALKLGQKPLTLDSGINDIEEWDSLGHLGILSALDKFFNGRIAPIKEIAEADSVAKMLRLLRKHSLI